MSQPIFQNSLGISLYHSPLGWIAIASTHKALIQLQLPEKSADLAWNKVIQNLKKWGHLNDSNHKDKTLLKNPSWMKKHIDKIHHYFSHPQEKIQFDIKKSLEMCSLSPFQKEALYKLYQVNPGVTLSYKELAIKIGHPKAFRAIGTAMRLNPLPIFIPCHRIILNSGELGVYASVKNNPIKYELLKMEGALT